MRAKTPPKLLPTKGRKGHMKVLLFVLASLFAPSALAKVDKDEVKRILSSDLYIRLNISAEATLAEIKSSYRKLAVKYHPDSPQCDPKHKDGELFIRINEAQEVLLDDVKRQRYDGLRSVQPEGSSSGNDFHASNGQDWAAESKAEAEAELRDLQALKKKYPAMSEHIDSVIREDVQLRIKHPGFHVSKRAPFLWPSDIKMVKDMIKEGSPSLLKHVVSNVMEIPGWENHPEIIDALIEKNNPEVLRFLSHFFVYKQWVTPMGAHYMNELIDRGYGGHVYNSLRVAGLLDGGPAWFDQKEGPDLMIRVIQQTTKESDPWLYDRLEFDLKMDHDEWYQKLSKEPEAKRINFKNEAYPVEAFHKAFKNRKFLKSLRGSCSGFLQKLTNVK